jgi:formylmethanofuran dehydrogenase subunit B
MGFRFMAELGPLTCAGCGLLCDDVVVSRTADGVRVTPDCSLGAAWFSERMPRADRPAATIDGRPVDVDAAVARAGELLRAARRPLVHGFEGATVEDARAALALADRLGALVATERLEGPWPGAPAIPLRGASTATLGEIRDRSRIVVIWREDPQITHPRLLERLRLSSAPAERLLVVVDDRATATAGRADLHLRWPRERDLEALVTLHAMQQDVAPQASDLAGSLGGLLIRIRDAPHTAFVYGPGLTAGGGGQRRALALHELVRALSHERHVVTLELPRAPGTRSADDVLAWQSGYAGKVDFASGHPELVTATQPSDEVDLTLLVESGSAGAADIAIGSLPPGPGAQVWVRTTAAGVSAVGTAHRLDGVPLTLQAPHPDDAPTAAALLTRLLKEVER